MKIFPSDFQLMRRIALRDEAAIELFIDRHRARVRNVLKIFRLQEADLEDCEQATWVRVWFKARSFRGESAVTSWLHRVAWNEGCMLVRKHKVLSPEIPVSTFPCDIYTRDRASMPDDRTGARCMLKRVQRKAEHLSGDKQAAWLAVSVYELSTTEAAAANGWTLAGTKSRIHRARRKIMKLMTPEEKQAVNF